MVSDYIKIDTKLCKLKKKSGFVLVVQKTNAKFIKLSFGSFFFNPMQNMIFRVKNSNANIYFNLSIKQEPSLRKKKSFHLDKIDVVTID